MKILIACFKVIYMTLIFPFACVANYIGLRIWRNRYKKMQYDSRAKFDEIPADFE